MKAQVIDAIIASERKAASKKIDFKANLNTSNYDITYHKLEFSVNPAIANISGKVTTTFWAKQDMTKVVFDLDNNMIVSKVIQNGNQLVFEQNANEELIITLQNLLISGESTTVSIEYSGNPTNNSFGSFEVSTHSGTPVLWTLSEPYGALGWWPCKQDLNDKIDLIDVFITAPKEYVSVSNGIEQSATISGDFKTTHFKHQYPIPAYLIAIAVTNYQTYSHTVSNNGNPFPIVNYVYPESLNYAQNNTPITVNIMNHFIDLFGNYPFEKEKYGHAQFGWGGGMEHTTVSFMGSFDRDLIAHELAHQWFGNKITCGSWKDIWLNEGFATFLTGVSIEHLEGETAYKNWRNAAINSITSAVDGAVYLSDADTLSVGRIFNGRLSYDKGAMVLHMLRKKLGETNFFKAIKNYITDSNLAYNYAKTPDLIAHLEAVSGDNLTEFFNDWVFNQGYPMYQINWFQPEATKVSIQLNQSQSHSSVTFFQADITIRLKGIQNETKDIVLKHTENNQIFLVETPFQIDSIEFDPNLDIISNNNTITLDVENQFVEKHTITIVPNPFSTTFTIFPSHNLMLKKIEIYTILGKKISEYTNLNIYFYGLSTGIYFAKIQTNKGTFIKKIIKNDSSQN